MIQSDVRDESGRTWDEFAAEYFAMTYCEVCSGAAVDHEPALLNGLWFASCKYEDIGELVGSWEDHDPNLTRDAALAAARKCMIVKRGDRVANQDPLRPHMGTVQDEASPFVGMIVVLWDGGPRSDEVIGDVTPAPDNVWVAAPDPFHGPWTPAQHARAATTSASSRREP